MPRYLDDATKRRSVLRSEVSEQVDATEAAIEQLWAETGLDDPRDAITRVDLSLQLPNEFLLMVDRFSMAHSVEARTPFLDHAFVESVLTLPAELRSPAGAPPKSLLINAVADLLPTQLRHGPKRGFVLPTGSWLRERLRSDAEELLSPSYLRRQGLFRPEVWSRILQPHLAGGQGYADAAWTLYMFQRWYRHHHG